MFSKCVCTVGERGREGGEGREGWREGGEGEREGWREGRTRFRSV